MVGVKCHFAGHCDPAGIRPQIIIIAAQSERYRQQTKLALCPPVEVVLAFGSPEGLRNTVTLGVISSVVNENRTIEFATKFNF